MAAPAVSSTTEEIKKLMKKKKDIEEELEELDNVLQSQEVGMEGPLVDKEGFPRSDVDVYTVRQARHRAICLQNDYKEVMREIEEELHRLHAEARQTTETSEAAASESVSAASTPIPASFAALDRVDAGSPSAAGGLEVGDELVEFGSITAKNFNGLRSIAEVVQHSKGRSVRVRVVRNGRVVVLNVTPSTWGGPGLLGCNIVPVQR